MLCMLCYVVYVFNFCFLIFMAKNFCGPNRTKYIGPNRTKYIYTTKNSGHYTPVFLAPAEGWGALWTPGIKEKEVKRGVVLIITQSVC